MNITSFSPMQKNSPNMMKTPHTTGDLSPWGAILEGFGPVARP